MLSTIFYNDQNVQLNYEILAPSLYVYKDILPKSLNLVERIENSLKIPNTPYSWKPANVAYMENNLSQRNCFDFKINEKILGERNQYNADLLSINKQIMDSLKMAMKHYISQNLIDEISYYECINIVKYGKGEYFKVHTDDGEPYRCTVSAVGYPNDDYEGGEIWFPNFNIKYKPVAGDFVIFPSSYAYSHSSEPVLNDSTKYSFVIMTDRTEFAHRADSPVYYDKEYRAEHGAKG